ALAQQAQTNVDRQREVTLMGQTIAEEIWEEGRLKGLTEGQTVGELRASRKKLRQLLAHRFGPLPEALNQAIEDITDAGRLDAAFERALQINDLADLQL